MASGEDLTDRFRELRASLDALPEVTEPPKPMLRILGSARAEQKWNTLLAYFLDPSQPHGFGADLLKAFLDKAGQVTHDEIEYYHRDIDQVSVETEVTSPQNNRLDIVIRAHEEWFVCIEAKVDAPQGKGKPERYVEDLHIGNEEKSEYPENGRHYLFLSKTFAPNVTADEFEDIYWRHIVEAFQEELNLSHGQYPERSAGQLEDFLSTIITVTNMEENDFEQIQKEKVQLLSEYRNDIDELLAAAESLRQRSIEEWPELFRSQVDDDVWTDEWHTRDDYGKYGCVFRDGWYRDNENLAPTLDHDETRGGRGIRLHFVHLIRKKKSFSEGQLTYILRSPASVDLRDEFNRLYNSQRWQNKLEPLLDERGISNKGNLRDYTKKTYAVDQSGLPGSYFETLAVAFKEHIPVAEVVDEILDEAVANIKDI
jgi:hypothetical protein